MDRFTIRLPEAASENVVISGDGRKAIVLADLPEHVRATIRSGERYRVIAPDGRETTATIVVKGLTAIAYLDSDIGLELALSCEQFVSTQYLIGAPGLTINFDTGSGFVSTSYLRGDPAISVELEADESLVYRYVGEHPLGISTDFASSGLTLVRLYVISDWSDFIMGDLQEKTMQDMIYQEV